MAEGTWSRLSSPAMKPSAFSAEWSRSLRAVSMSRSEHSVLQRRARACWDSGRNRRRQLGIAGTNGGPEVDVRNDVQAAACRQGMRAATRSTTGGARLHEPPRRRVPARLRGDADGHLHPTSRDGCRSLQPADNLFDYTRPATRRIPPSKPSVRCAPSWLRRWTSHGSFCFRTLVPPRSATSSPSSGLETKFSLRLLAACSVMAVDTADIDSYTDERAADRPWSRCATG